LGYSHTALLDQSSQLIAEVALEVLGVLIVGGEVAQAFQLVFEFP
jgi:hypothetical protein